MTARAWALSALILVGSVAPPPARAASESPTYEFVNGHWFDGEKFVARPYYSVLGELHPNRPWQVDSVVDLHGGYVIPPFGEAHNHNAGLKGGTEVTRRYLREGIFYVKNPCNLPRDRADSGQVNVPRSIDVVYSNGGITAPDGHPMGLVRRNIARGVMTESDGEGAFYFTVASVADLDRKWPAILAGKPDFIKTLLLYSEEYDRRRADTAYFAWKGLDPKLLPEVVRRAHTAKLRVSTHVETANDFRYAVAAGVDEINHLPGFRPERDDIARYVLLERYAITDRDAKAAASRGIAVVTTVSEVLEALAGVDSTSPERARADSVRRMIVGNLQALRRHAVRIALGSDRFRNTSTAEARALHGLGIFDNLTLLKMWCEDTPRDIFPERKITRLRDGYEASFLVLEGDPIADFDNLGRIRIRVKQGIILGEP